MSSAAPERGRGVILRRYCSRRKPLALCLPESSATDHYALRRSAMGNRKKREPGPQLHAEGQHGEKTHKRFIEILQEGRTIGEEGPEKRTEAGPVEGHHRLHQDRQQHDEAEKNSEKVEAMKEV